MLKKKTEERELISYKVYEVCIFNKMCKSFYFKDVDLATNFYNVLKSSMLKGSHMTIVGPEQETMFSTLHMDISLELVTEYRYKDELEELTDISNYKIL